MLSTKPCTSDFNNENEIQFDFHTIHNWSTEYRYLLVPVDIVLSAADDVLLLKDDNNRKGEIDDEDDIELYSPSLADDWFKSFEELQDVNLEEPLYETSRQTVPKDVHNLPYSNGSEYRDAHPYPDSNNPIMNKKSCLRRETLKLSWILHFRYFILE